jgi:hypothetical protein
MMVIELTQHLLSIKGAAAFLKISRATLQSRGILSLIRFTDLRIAVWQKSLTL